MESIDTFQTERLTAERLREEDFDVLSRMHQDPKVMATMGGVRSDEKTREYLRENLDHLDRHGYGLWMFRDRANAQFVGRGVLRNVHVGGHDEVEVGYALVADAWGKGLATEMAEALLTIAFKRLAMTDVVAFTQPTNRASRRIIEKLGMTFERDIVHEGLPHVLYRIDRAAWEDRK